MRKDIKWVRNNTLFFHTWHRLSPAKQARTQLGLWSERRSVSHWLLVACHQSPHPPTFQISKTVKEYIKWHFLFDIKIPSNDCWRESKTWHCMCPDLGQYHVYISDFHIVIHNKWHIFLLFCLCLTNVILPHKTLTFSQVFLCETRAWMLSDYAKLIKPSNAWT